MKHEDCANLSGPCGLNWDRKYNVKSIRFCPVHAAAHALLAALERFVSPIDCDCEEDDVGDVDGDCNFCLARTAIAAAKGNA